MIGKKINQLATELAPTTTDLTIIGDPVTGVSKKITLEQLGAIFGGAVSFYTTLGDFPATGVIDIIYCAKDTKKLYLWSGSAYVEVFPSQSLLDTYQLRSEKGVSNGYASLDVNGKVPIGQLPNSIMEYKGTWNAATNTPTLANGTGDTGDVYICNVAGTVNFGAGPITFAVGDYVVYSGTIWQRSSGAVGTVTSVAVSRSGDALAITGSPITTSGTINLGFAGNSTQYINGAGNLVTFPGIINEAQNLITEVYNKTGATLTKGTVVYINGGQGNLPAVTKALATGDATSAQTYGIVRNDITNNNNGYVVVAGRISDLDTQAYTEGTQLYLSPTTAGTYTSTKPYAPNHLVYVGIVVRAHPTQGVIEVKIQNGYEMDELHNVSAQSPDNNDILQYKTATSLWTKVAGTTTNIAEGTNLYYTDARSRAALSFTAGSGAYNSTTGVITIPTNTNQLTNGAAFITLASLSAGAGISYNNTTGVITSTITQYTDALARAAISLTTTGTSGAATYNSTTGVLNVPQYTPDLSGYVPTSRTLTINGTTFDLSANRSWSVGTVTSVGLSSATSGVTIGSTPITTSGTITLAIATASGSQNGLLSSTDWTTFNNKQNALTNPVTGTGNNNYIAKFTTTGSTIGNSQIFDTGSEVRIFTTSTDARNFTLGVYGVTWDNTLFEVANDVSIFNKTSADNGDIMQFRTVGGQRGDIRATTSSFTISSRTSLILGSNNTNQATLDTSGNLGLGVTPSAWGSVWNAIQMNNGVSLSSYKGAGGSFPIMELSANAIDDGTSKYVVSNFASKYSQFSGSHVWLNAPSGTAGNAISFTQAMTLDASGRLSIGNTSVSAINERLNVTGNGIAIEDSDGGREMLLGHFGGADGILGTFTNDALQIRTNNIARLTIASTGAATFSSSVTAQTGEFISGGQDGSLGSVVRISTTSTNANARNWGIVNTWDNFGDLTFRVSNAQGGNALSAGTSIMTMLRTGNVGIGTTSPSTKFVVSNAGAGGIEMQGNSSVSGGAFLQTYNRSTNAFFDFDIVANNMIFRTGQSYATALTIASTGASTFATTIQTGAPTNGTAQPWRLGDARSGSISTNSYIIVSVNGTTYSIPALNGLP